MAHDGEKPEEKTLSSLVIQLQSLPPHFTFQELTIPRRPNNLPILLPSANFLDSPLLLSAHTSLNIQKTPRDIRSNLDNKAGSIVAITPHTDAETRSTVKFA